MRLWHICLCIYGCLNVNSRINLLFCTQSDFYRYSSFVVVSCATFFPLHPIIPNSGKTLEKNFVGKKLQRKKSEEIKTKERNQLLGQKFEPTNSLQRPKERDSLMGFTLETIRREKK